MKFVVGMRRICTIVGTHRICPLKNHYQLFDFDFIVLKINELNYFV